MRYSSKLLLNLNRENMKYCSKHHANPDDALFCNECGERLVTVNENIKKCPACNAENPKEAHFCHSCGGSLTVNSKPQPKPQPKLQPISHPEPRIVSSSSDSNLFESVIKEINRSFVSNYRETENFLLGKIGMWTSSLMSVVSLYFFINCCINNSGWALLHLVILLSYIGICYQKKLGAIVWVISFFILNITTIIDILDIIKYNLLGNFIEEAPLSAISILICFFGLGIVATKLYKEKDSIFWK